MKNIKDAFLKGAQATRIQLYLFQQQKGYGTINLKKDISSNLSIGQAQENGSEVEEIAPQHPPILKQQSRGGLQEAVKNLTNQLGAGKLFAHQYYNGQQQY